MNKEVVLIHGWGTKNYNSNLVNEVGSENVAWKERRELIDKLEEKYVLKYFNLPGFCGVPEPEADSFDLEDFADYFAKWLENQGTKPLAIIGYSFGGALALEYKCRYKSDIPLALVAPALKRQETARSYAASLGKNIIPSKYFDLLKSFYQVVFSKYYREGTPFLRASYDKIARRDVRSLLGEVSPKDILLVYGDSDGSTPFSYVSELVDKRDLNCYVIAGGDHNIGQTHPDEISSAIIDFFQNNYDFRDRQNQRNRF